MAGLGYKAWEKVKGATAGDFNNIAGLTATAGSLNMFNGATASTHIADATAGTMTAQLNAVIAALEKAKITATA